MATVSTDAVFFWYQRLGPKVNTIGIVNKDGDAVDSGLTVELHAEVVNVTQGFENTDELNLRDESYEPFVDGVISAVMKRLTGQSDAELEFNFEQEKIKLRGIGRAQQAAGATKVNGKNFRSDHKRYTYTRSENL